MSQDTNQSIDLNTFARITGDEDHNLVIRMLGGEQDLKVDGPLLIKLAKHKLFVLKIQITIKGIN